MVEPVSEAPAKPERYFATRYTFDPGRTPVWRAIARHLQRYIPAGATVCELGSGYADWINHVDAGRKYALDLHADSARHCAPEVTFLCSETSRIEIESGSVDVILASNLLEHLGDAALHATMSEIGRTLRKGGRLVLIQPDYYYCYRRYWDDFTHVKAWTHHSLPDFLSASGFEVERVEARFLPFSFKGRLPRSYWLTRLYLALPWRPWAAQMLVVARKADLHV